MLKSLLWLTASGALFLASCSTSPDRSEPPPVTAQLTAEPSTPAVSEAVAGPSILPVDSSIMPISIASHSGEAEAAFKACAIEQYGYQTVAGMGLIPTAADLPKYAPFSGKEPELKLAGPVWLIQFKGEIPMPGSGEKWVDPICIEASNDQGFLAVNGVKDAAGVFQAALPPARPPTFSVPALRP